MLYFLSIDRWGYPRCCDQSRCYRLLQRRKYGNVASVSTWVVWNRWSVRSFYCVCVWIEFTSYYWNHHTNLSCLLFHFVNSGKIGGCEENLVRRWKKYPASKIKHVFNRKWILLLGKKHHMEDGSAPILCFMVSVRKSTPPSIARFTGYQLLSSGLHWLWSQAHLLQKWGTWRLLEYWQLFLVLFWFSMFMWNSA